MDPATIAKIAQMLMATKKEQPQQQQPMTAPPQSFIQFPQQWQPQPPASYKKRGF